MSDDVVFSPDLFTTPVICDGVETTVRPGSWTTPECRLWREQFGAAKTLEVACDELFVYGGLDMDHFGALLWLQRRADGETDLKFADVVFDYDDMKATRVRQNQYLQDLTAEAAGLDKVPGKRRGKTRPPSTPVDGGKPTTPA